MRKFAGLVLLAAALCMAISALWIPVKAVAAQALLRLAWASALESQAAVKPWPWADMHPLLRLQIARIGLESIVLSDASGRSLAFGPGKVAGTVAPGQPGVCVISAHRDTHFAPLQQIVRGDQIVVHDTASRRFVYEVVDMQITDRTPSFAIEPGSETLLLSTCYPFKSVAAGGELRFIVIAARRAGASPARSTTSNRS